MGIRIFINSDPIKKNGQLDLVVAWIHLIAENALELIVQEASKNNEIWTLFHVLGSSTNLDEIKKSVNVPDSCQYRQVQLGFILENGYSRWLTNEEISDGVINSLVNGNVKNIVGTIEPWNERP